MPPLARLQTAIVLLCCLSSAYLVPLSAQQGGPPRGGPPSGPGGGNPQPGGMNNAPGASPGMGNSADINRGGPPPGSAPDQQGMVSSMRGGLQIGPPGRWCDDTHFAKDLRLHPEQQKKMDDIFDQNRAALLRTYEGLQQEEQRMQALVNAPVLDENALFAQIDRVAQARAALEKANTHLMLQIRAEMTPDQIARMNQHH
jgi:Spy/CpxP family protein refolding chaperone